MRHLLLTRLWIPILFVGLSGCLPTACNRTESRALFPADSLSRDIASELPVDTLRTAGSFVAPEVLGYPRTLGYAPDGRLWVADSEREVLLQEQIPDRASSDSEPGDSLSFTVAAELPGSVPWLAGFQGDTPVVYSPVRHEMMFISGGEVTQVIALQGIRPERGALTYAAADSSGFMVKVLAEEFDSYLARLDQSGTVLESRPLSGPPWLHAGLIRPWNGRVASLRGYLPSIDIWGEGGLDSLALLGFDSPMLSRTRSYMLGNVKQPPLLTASAAPSGDRLFVLNMRPGWLRVDVFDKNGRLQKILTQPNPEFGQEYFPTDIAVRRLAGGGYELAVAVLQPEARVDRYRWHPAE